MILTLLTLSCATPDKSGGPIGEPDPLTTTETPDVDCEVTLVWYQKDAYKDDPGRASDLWPPHTTTALEVVCGDEPPWGATMPNHGTDVDDLHESGAPMLDVVLREPPFTAPRATAEALVAAFSACDCETETQFLSMDAVEDAAIQVLIGELVWFMDTYLVCGGGVSTGDVVDLLLAGDIGGLLAALPACTFDGSAGWAEGFDLALEALVAQTGETLADYHVCNNDALMQASLVDAFAAGEGVSCDPRGDLCAGPRWLLDPR